MKGTSRWNGWAWTAMAFLVAAAPAAAQGGARGGGRGMGPGTPGVERNIEAALARAEELGLDEARIQALRELQADLTPVREELDREMEAFRTEWRGERPASRDSLRARMQANREQMEAYRERRIQALAPFQARYESILTVEERVKLRDALRDGRGGRAGALRSGGRSGAIRGGMVGGNLRGAAAFRGRGAGLPALQGRTGLVARRARLAAVERQLLLREARIRQFRRAAFLDRERRLGGR